MQRQGPRRYLRIPYAYAYAYANADPHNELPS